MTVAYLGTHNFSQQQVLHAALSMRGRVHGQEQGKVKGKANEISVHQIHLHAFQGRMHGGVESLHSGAGGVTT